MLSARKLVLDLATARPAAVFTIASMCRAAQIVGISEASVRMAAMRLADEGALERVGRGEYRLDATGLNTFAHVGHWRTRLAGLVDWDGTWIGADTSTASGTRTQLRRIERELDLLGFTRWRGSLLMRPANLAGGVRTLRELTDTRVSVFGIVDLDVHDAAELRDCWDVAALHRSHREVRAELSASLGRRSSQDDEQFARESLPLGARAIAQIIHDPLLPTSFDDHHELRELINATINYQDVASEVWEQLLWATP
ncbi:hypothetical protein MYK68_11695 [Gordonia sp. PP30]|uniref:hypothetical protein n=1 Tax=unclassified Gordonia (in: high G+C Gram-positive bacteria) TaxID=2657482 RepID=UPI0020003F9A|nr:hypothetical protein [Gordonia sp. PP30]UQE73427.1 hypothetical protein MYK68_11695 [Gordonia sp. PP30]